MVTLGIFHVVHNAIQEFKIFNNSTDKLKALNEKLYFARKQSHTRKQYFIPVLYLIFCYQKREEKDALNRVNFNLSAIFLYS